MSADNWAICPKCKKEHKVKREEALKQARALYGRIPLEQYEKQLQDALNIPIEIDESLREDYEIGVTRGGKFYVDYGCMCECGFKFSFKHEEVICP